MDLVGDVLARELGQSLGRGDLHRVVDRAGTNVQRAAEDVGEAEDVVHLVGIVAASGGNDRVRADRPCLLRRDLGIGIGHGEDDRLVGHGGDHVLGQRAFHRQAEEDVGPLHGLAERAGLGGGGVGGLPLVHALGPALVDDTLGVAQDHVVRAHTHGLEQFDTGDGGGAGAVHDQLGLAQFPAGEVAGVDQAGGGDDRGAVLVVMEDRDIHQFAQPLLDDEAFRRLDVFQIDAAEAGPEEADGVDEFIDVLGADLEIDTIDVSEALEERDLAFHDRLGRDRAQVA